jgi:hypothetical protein
MALDQGRAAAWLTGRSRTSGRPSGARGEGDARCDYPLMMRTGTVPNPKCMWFRQRAPAATGQVCHWPRQRRQCSSPSRGTHPYSTARSDLAGPLRFPCIPRAAGCSSANSSGRGCRRSRGESRGGDGGKHNRVRFNLGFRVINTSYTWGSLVFSNRLSRPLRGLSFTRRRPFTPRSR